jgi:hypothetical protein
VCAGDGLLAEEVFTGVRGLVVDKSVLLTSSPRLKAGDSRD